MWTPYVRAIMVLCSLVQYVLGNLFRNELRHCMELKMMVGFLRSWSDGALVERLAEREVLGRQAFL